MTDPAVTWPEPGPLHAEEMYYPKDAIELAIKNTVALGGAGLLFASVQNSMSKQNLGTLGVISRFGSTTALTAGMGGTYAFVSAAAANLRQNDDHISKAIGGFAAGALGGLYRRTMPAVLGHGMALGVVIGVAAYSGQYMFGAPDVHPDEGRWPTKEELRKRFRRPLNETINELGEGRGIYGPGYAERRAQRIKDNHGIEVTPPYWETQAPAEPMR